MAERIRADALGSYHHVTNRGVARRALFENRGEGHYFTACGASAVVDAVARFPDEFAQLAAE